MFIEYPPGPEDAPIEKGGKEWYFDNSLQNFANDLFMEWIR